MIFTSNINTDKAKVIGISMLFNFSFVKDNFFVQYDLTSFKISLSESALKNHKIMP